MGQRSDAKIFLFEILRQYWRFPRSRGGEGRKRAGAFARVHFDFEL